MKSSFLKLVTLLFLVLVHARLFLFISTLGYNNTELIIKLEDALGQWLVPNTLSVLRMSINELLANHYRVLLTFDDRSDASYSKQYLIPLPEFNSYSAFYIHDLIQGEYANSDDIATMTNHNQQLIEQRDPNYLLELSWTLTAQVFLFPFSLIPIVQNNSRQSVGLESTESS